MNAVDAGRLFADGLDHHAAVVRDVRAQLAAPFAAMLASWQRTLAAGGKLLLFGNGGSAADAEHIATELTVRYRHDRAPIPAVALTCGSPAITAAANDLGFEMVFARQVAALGRPGDLALGISTSGRSANVVAGLRTAGELGLTAAALTAGDGGLLSAVADPILAVPATDTGRIQEMHILLGHLLCEAVELTWMEDLGT